MTDLIHRVKVFVFRRAVERPEEPDYLLLRSAGFEGLWGPLHGSIGFGEKLEAAVRREVLSDVGILQPADLIDLKLPGRWLVGDEEVIEWTYGCRVLPSQEPERVSDRWSEYRWADFGAAYPSLEIEADRAAILRLHALLHDAA